MIRNYQKKYLEYKAKYLLLKTSQVGGGGYNCNPSAILLNKFCNEVNGSGDYKTLEECINGCMERKRGTAFYEKFLYDSPDKTMTMSANNSVQSCLICHQPITSSLHSDTCLTVSMWESNQQHVDEKFKPMMTFGLRGCTAGLVAIKEDDLFINVFLIHHPSKDIVKQKLENYLRTYIDTKYSSFVIIRCPGEWNKNDSQKYNIIPKDIIYWETFLGNNDCIFCIEPYSESECGFESYNKTLHCKMVNDELHYTNTSGEWKSIENCNA